MYGASAKQNVQLIRQKIIIQLSSKTSYSCKYKYESLCF